MVCSVKNPVQIFEKGNPCAARLSEIYMKKICVLFLAILLLLPVPAQATEAFKDDIEETGSVPSYEEFAEGIIEWEKQQFGVESGASLLSPALWEGRSAHTLIWLVFAMERLGVTGDYGSYLDALSAWISEMYEKPEKLSKNKATEWHRAALGILAAGGDPTDVGGIDLIADGIYARGEDAPLGKQGINGWIWGLLVLDTKGYEIPSGSNVTRESILNEIIRMRLPGGGFALTGDTPDPDITAAALTALAPYRGGSEIYGQGNELGGATVDKVIDEAVEALSRVQCASGGFRNPLTGENAESTAQVLLALTTLGIDWQNDSRFTKNGVNLYEALAAYRTDDGGIKHLPTDEAANATASVQALYTIAALLRAEKGQSSLFDFRDAAVSDGASAPDTTGTERPDSGKAEDNSPVTGDAAAIILSVAVLCCLSLFFILRHRSAAGR